MYVCVATMYDVCMSNIVLWMFGAAGKLELLEQVCVCVCVSSNHVCYMHVVTLYCG